MSSTRTSAQRKRANAIRSSARPHSAEPAPPAFDEEDWEPEALRSAMRTPRWASAVGLAICVIGVGIASYLTAVHYAGITPVCPAGAGSIINCGQVVTSQWSTIFGIPVPVLGLVFFVGMLPLQLPAAWRSNRAVIRVARLGGTVVGVGMILWLIYAELFLVGKICLWCTSVHVLTFILFCTTLFGTLATTPEPLDA